MYTDWITQDPELSVPKVDLIVKLANPVNELLTLRLKIPNTTRVELIHKEISRMHQGAISGIVLCRDRFNPEEALPPMKTLADCGVVDGEVKCFYDYKPVTGPLLKWLGIVRIHTSFDRAWYDTNSYSNLPAIHLAAIDMTTGVG